MPKTWTHQLPMRWADIDMLKHVNNVTYLEYAAEAQALLADELPFTGQPSEVTVRFAAPMMISRTPVTVVSSLDSELLNQEIRSGESSHADITSRWSVNVETSIPAGADGPEDVRIRIGDVDASGRVSMPKLFELIQETRVLVIAERLAEKNFGQFVVGTVSLRIHDELRWRETPYQANGWFSRVGNASFTVETVISDSGQPKVSATSVLVGFDLETQKSRAFSEQERDLMQSAVLG